MQLALFNKKLSPQQERILNALSSGEWVECYKLVYQARCLQYNSRIKELREMGYDIKNKVIVVNGEKHGWFKLWEL